MDFHFGTPSRLERQIAQDLMRDQSELDLSLPAASTRNQSLSFSRQPLNNSYTNNHASYSRASTSSAGSLMDEQSFDISNHQQPAKVTSRPPLSLAGAVASSQNQNAATHAKENIDPRPESSRSSSTSSPSFRPGAKHGTGPRGDAEVDHGIAPFSASSSVSMDSNADASSTRHFPDPYGHLRTVSPPLTSTPQRGGPPSTVGSRSRTTLTIRPAPSGSAAEGGHANRSRGTVLDSTLGSASQRSQSVRTRSNGLADLTESSIAPDDPDAAYESEATNVDLARQGHADTDFVVYDATSAAPTSEAGAVLEGNHESHTGTMHTAEIQNSNGPAPLSRSPQRSSASTDLSGSAGSDQRRRREERRQLGELRDESMIDEDEEEDQFHDASRSRSSTPTKDLVPPASPRDANSMHVPRDGMPPSQAMAPDPSNQISNEAEAEAERTGTTFSSPAAARLTRKGIAGSLARNRAGVTGTASNQTPPQRSVQDAGAHLTSPEVEEPGKAPEEAAVTPRAQIADADRERRKSYALNSIKATATIGSSRKDTRRLTLERLQAQAMLHQTPGRLLGEQVAESDESSSTPDINTPRLRMDRLGKANTVAAGRTPLPRGGMAELLRRGALSRLGDTSGRSDSIQTPASARNSAVQSPALGLGATDSSIRSGADHQTILESLAGLSEASSNDLTAPPQTSVHGPLGLRANTSFPGLGAAEAGTNANTAARPRVDPGRLAVYQSKLNARLDAENEELKKERDDLSRLLDELRRENEELRQRQGGPTFPSSPAQGGSDEQSKQQPQEELIAERERANALDREAQELADLLDERERQIEVLQADIERLQRDVTDTASGASHSRGIRGEAGTGGDETMSNLRYEVEELQTQLRERDEDIADLEERLEGERKQMEEQVQQAKAYSFETLEKVEAARDQALTNVQRLEAELEESRQQVDRLRAELDSQQARIDGKSSAESENVKLRQQLATLDRRNAHLESEAQNARNDVAAASASVEEGTRRIQSLEKQIEEWKAEVADLEADLADEKERADRAEDDLAHKASDQDPNATAKESEFTQTGPSSLNSTQSKKTSSLERKLVAAQSTIDQLTAQLDARADHSRPPRSDHVKDMEIDLLKQQKDELLQRVEEYREMISVGVGNNLAVLSSQHEQGTPQASDRKASTLAPVTPGLAGTSGAASPLPKSVISLRQLSPMKTPRSPAPLSEASWLYNESSLGGAGVAERIAFLESALDDANASIDAKLQKLDSAGVAHLTLAERLARANQRIEELEAELERLRMRASVAGGGTASFSASDSPNKSSRSAVQRQRVFADVHAQLEALKSRWAGDHDQLKQREAEVERRENELADRSREKREHRGVLAELDKFRDAAASLQQDLHAEQERQREMLAKSKAASQEKVEIERRLASTQSELEAVKRRLHEKVGGLEHLSRQLSDSSHQTDRSVDGRSNMQAQIDRLNRQVQSAQAQVEELKQERLDLLSQRADLHAKFAQVNAQYDSVAADLALSRQALAAHQTQLDEQIEQMEAAHTALRGQKADYDEVVDDRDRLRAERNEIIRDVALFESELRRVRKEADRQGSDLEALRVDRERAQLKRAREDEEKQRMRDRDMKEVQSLVRELKLKTKEVEQVKAKLEEADRIRSAAPPPYSSASQQREALQQTLVELRSQHAQECKGLMLQIRYLKQKLTRETDLRSDLAHQKTYITLLLRGLIDVDAEVGRILLDLQIESAERKSEREALRLNPARRRWHVAGKAVLSMVRMGRMAAKWSKTCEIKASLQQAHHHVRERRREAAAEGEKHGHVTVATTTAVRVSRPVRPLVGDAQRSRP